MPVLAGTIEIIRGTDQNPPDIDGSGGSVAQALLDFQSEVTTGLVEYHINDVSGIIAEIWVTPGTPAPTAGWIIILKDEAGNPLYTSPTLSAKVTYSVTELNITVAGTLKIYASGMGATPARAKLTIKFVDQRVATININSGNPSALIVDLPTDHTFSGPSVSRVAGENLVFGDVCYKKSDGKYWKADATDSTKVIARLIAAATILANATGLFIKFGSYIRDDSWSWTVGAPLYLAVGGGLTETAPNTTNQVVQVIGVAETADIIDFSPSQDFITIV